MEEMLDVFDINGNYLGVKSRTFCHSENPGVYHKPVWIWIINSKGEVLVQKRAKMKKKAPGKYDMPSAGHVDAGESSISGCIRETYEELGIRTKEEDYIFLTEYFAKDAWEFGQVYLLKVDVDIKGIKLQEEEVECVKWLSYNEFVDLLYSDQFCSHDKEYKDYVANVLKEYTK